MADNSGAGTAITTAGAATGNPWLIGAGALLTLFGGTSAADAQKQAGQKAQEAANLQASQMRYNAGQTIAAGQASAEEATRQADLMKSRIIAVAGASGAGVMDPTVVNLAANAAYEGKLAAQTRVFNAETNARMLEQNAAVVEKSGQAQAAAGSNAATGTLLTTAGSLFSTLGRMQ